MNHQKKPPGKFLFPFFFALLLISQANAQNFLVSGKVINAKDSSALPGVAVIAVGSQLGTLTDAQGKFSLELSPGISQLEFKLLGKKTQRLHIEGRNYLEVYLEEDELLLDDITIIAYGTQASREVSSAISSVAEKEIRNLPLISPDQLLQGRAAGVHVMQNSGTPGSGVAVRVRGGSSISAGNEPLYVLDGVPITTGSFTAVGAGGQLTNALSDLNPADIASIEILKDAAAAAIYGSRASNGVVLITTKRGQGEQTHIRFNYFYGRQQAARRVKMLNGTEYVNLVRESRSNRGLIAQPPGVALDSSINTNWQDLIFRTAPMAQYELSMDGGSKNTRFYLSGTWFEQKGIIVGSGFKRLSTRLNLDHQLNKYLSLGMSNTISRAVNQRIMGDNSISGVLTTAMLVPPIVKPYNDDGSYGRRPDLVGSQDNPLARAYEPTFEAVQSRLISNVFAEFHLGSFSFRSSWGLDFLHLKDDRYDPTTTNQGQVTDGYGISAVSQQLNRLSEQLLSYRKKNDRYSLDAVAGFSAQESQFERTFAQATGFPGDDFEKLNAGAVKVNASSEGSSWALISWFTRWNYSYLNRYLLSLSMRADGSSRFSPRHRVGYFPALSAGWLVSEEDFMKKMEALSLLKLRGSYGLTGNSEIPDAAWRGLYGIEVPLGGTNTNTNYLDRAGMVPTQLANPDLRWEPTAQLGIGLDIGFFNNRLSAQIDYYQRRTKDLLLSAPVPATSGFTVFTRNIGALQNRGWEISLQSHNLTGLLRWTSNFNIAFNRNRITALADNQPISLGVASIVAVGQPLGAFYGFVAEGVYKDDDDNSRKLRNGSAQGALFRGGDMKFKDLDGNGYIDAADRTFIGSAQPDFTGGVNNVLTYKGFELSLLLQFVYGNQVFNNNRSFNERMHSYFAASEATLRRWRKAGDVTDVPRAVWQDPMGNGRVSSRFLEDASYARIKNVSFAWQLPKKWLGRMYLQQCRVYVAAQNLFTFTRYSGFDPEVSTFNDSNINRNGAMGTDFFTYPQARTFTMGINLGI